MSFNYKSLLPTPAQIKAEFPLTPECVELKAARDKEVADVITGKSKKFLVIIGPCSADREDAVCEYMSRLAKVNEQVKDKLVIVPRVYTISRVPQAADTRECFISRIQRRSRICTKDL